MEKKQRIPKEKRKNLEKRKLKSRDAARCRRGKETEIFTDLLCLLPLSRSTCVSHLDKASVIRIAISYLKIRTIIQSLPVSLDENLVDDETFDSDSLFLNALDGFLLVANTDGDIVYISENVNRYLGLSQVDLLGQSIYEISHPCDHSEIKEMLSTEDTNSQKSYFLRLKCTLTNRGRNVNIKSASYKVVHFSGRIIKNETIISSDCNKQELYHSENESCDSNIDELPKMKTAQRSSFHFIALAEPIPHPANIEIPLGQNIFLTKHSLDMKFIYADEKMIDFLGYNPDDLLNESVFCYHHAEDSAQLQNCFKNLFEKGQSQTEKYRFLANGGGYAWVLSQATIINNGAQKPQSVVCVNFVISGIEQKNEIYSLCQIKKENAEMRKSKSSLTLVQNSNVDVNTSVRNKSMKKVTVTVSSTNKDENSNEKCEIMCQSQPKSVSVNDFLINCPEKFIEVIEVNTVLTEVKKQDVQESNEKSNLERVTSQVPQPATTHVFVPFTEDMNKGFLGFADDDDKELTMLPDDSEDLTHLAPTAGDVFVPLDETPIEYVFPDAFDDYILSDCKLHSNENSDNNYLSSPTSSIFSYESNLADSPSTLSSLLSTNDDSNIPSLESGNSPLSSGLVDNFLNFESLIQSTDEKNDLTMKNSMLSIPLGADSILSDFMWDSSPIDDSNWSLRSSLPRPSESSPMQSDDAVSSIYDSAEETKNNVFELTRDGCVSKSSSNERNWDDSREGSSMVGSKRSRPQNWKLDDLCKRRKHSVKSYVTNWVDDLTAENIRKVEPSTNKSNGSVLMNLLVGDSNLISANRDNKSKRSEEATEEDMQIIERALRTDNLKDMDVDTWSRVRKKLLSIIEMNNCTR